MHVKIEEWTRDMKPTQRTMILVGLPGETLVREVRGRDEGYY